MSTEEAKSQFLRAEELYKAGEYEESLAILEDLRRALPSSRRVIYQEALCLVSLGRFDEALASCDRLEGKLDSSHIKVLRDKIARGRRLAKAGRPVSEKETDAAPAPPRVPASPPKAEKPPRPSPPPAQPAAPSRGSQNVFQIESVFPLSTNETTVTGRVVEGAFYAGDTVSVLSVGGAPLLAPIARIGSAETPIRVVRQGQQTMMVLGVEPQHVGLGTRITSTGTSEAYAETMVVSSDAEAMGGGGGAAEVGISPELEEVEALLNERRFGPAKERVDAYLARDPVSSAGHRLLARIHLEADDELQDNALALECVQKAYEFGGNKDPAVLETLAKALGATGRAEQGIRYLEHLYSLATEDEAQEALAKRIGSYRTQFRLGNVWEFMNNWNDIVYESGSIDEIEKAIANGSIPKDAKCRRNRTGEWRTIEEELVAKYPQLAAFYTTSGSAVVRNLGMGAFAGLVIGVVGSLFIPGAAGNAPLLIGMAAGAAAIGACLGALVGIQAGKKQRSATRKRGK